MDEEFDPETPESEDKQDKAISSDLIRGHINTIILRALYDGDKYGYEIIAEIESKSHGQYSLKQPTLYSALKRLEKDGYITSYWGGSVGGGRRKYFSLTDAGKLISEQNQSEWEYSRTIIDSLISDRDFDFSNPAPTYVNMRVLKDTTSRVPSREDGDDEPDFEAAFGDAERARLEDEHAQRMAALEQEKAALEAEKARFEEEMRSREDALRTQEEVLRSEHEAQAELLKNERDAQETSIAEREQLVEAEYKKYEEIRAAQLEEVAAAKAEREEMQRQMEQTVADERARYDFLLTEKEKQMREEREQHLRELEALEKRIRAEDEILLRQREQQIIHQNYINLVNAPPETQQPQTYSYITQPGSPAEAPATSPPAPASQTPDGEDYQSVVHRLYANARPVAPDPAADGPDPKQARSLDGIDFRDIEQRAVQDNIRITTAGGKPRKKTSGSENIVHKGKALFLSAIAVFFFCLVLGIVAMGVRTSVGLPQFYPYFIWAIGVCLLLITGLAYANHYGKRALRRTGPVIVNAIVIYALLVIATLIVALAVNGDFGSTSYIMTFIVFPIVFFFWVIIFGVTYYLQVRPHRKK